MKIGRETQGENSSAKSLVVEGKNFAIATTQEIQFVELSPSFKTLPQRIPKSIDLRSIQSSVKAQGQRGSCTYFVLTGLVESYLKKTTGIEIDISEEYLAWSAKTQMRLRTNEEDSSVAVNAATIQAHGFLLEDQMPYQLSWFNKGFPCEGKKGESNIPANCFSHSGPEPEAIKFIQPGSGFVFEAVDSRALDVILALARNGLPVTVSILGHPRMWQNSQKSGDLILDEKMKGECQKKIVPCSGHAALIIGYDLKKNVFLFKNSWGTEWGMRGYGTISFDYIDQMSPRKFMTMIPQTRN